VQLKTYTPSPAEKKKDTLLEISRLSNDLFHFLLTKHKLGARALEYLKSRKISKQSIADFELGYSPRQQNFLFKFLIKKGFTPPDIISSGLALSTSSGPIDRFRGRILFPIFDVQGRCVGFSARALGNDEPKYLNSPETPLFNKSKALYGINLAKSAIKKEKGAVLVEGNLDVISSHQVGVTNTVAPLGTALTVQQVESLKRLTDRIFFAFDTDLAGDAAAKRGIEIAENLGMNMRVVEFEGSKDPDEVIKKSPTIWKKSINEAVPVYEHFISSAIKRHGTDTAEGKRRVAIEILPILARLSDEILRSHYLQSLSLKLAVEENDLREAMKKYLSDGEESKIPSEILEKPLTVKVADIVEKYLLALIIQSGSLPKKSDRNLFSEGQYQEIFNLIKDFKKDERGWKVKIFSKKLPEALLPLFDSLLLLEIDESILEGSEKLEKEIGYCTNRLKEMNLRKEMKELSLAIKQAEAIGDDDKIRALAEKFRDMSGKLSNLEVK